ncbi:MAG TPA: hypothetical protein VGM06_04385 [Polyangiaceae bacterium]|jgi:hypothetical protein
MRRSLFAIDPRSFVAYRAALGAIVLLDLLSRSATLADHYSDAGVLPRAALADRPFAAYRFCLHAWGGSAAFEGLLFVCAAALSVAFIAGRGGRVTTALLWVLTVSLHNRNAMVLNKGDQIFRLLLFWTMFLPLRPKGPLLSMATAGLLVQAALAWLTSAALKTGHEWFPDGTATYFALQMNHGTTAFGHRLGHMFALTRVLTYGVYFVEWGAPLLLFSPVRTTAARLVAITLLAAMHVGFGLSLRLGFFPEISICSLLPFVPSIVWDRIGVLCSDRRPRGLAPWPNAIATAALALVVSLDAVAVSGERWPIPGAIERLANLLRLDQSWAMFAPYPDKRTGWFVVRGHIGAGRLVDAYHPSLEPPPLDEPANLSGTFPSTRWLYYMTNLSKPEYAWARPWFAAFACRRFDATHLTRERLRDVELSFFLRWTLLDYERTPAEEDVLWQQPCKDTD